MENLNFNKTIWIFYGASVIMIALLALLTSFAPTRVVNSNLSDSFHPTEKIITVEFNAPLGQSNTLSVSLNSNDEIDYITAGNRLIIQLKSNLEYQTDYKITAVGLRDSYGNLLDTLELDFRTIEPQLIFTEKNRSGRDEVYHLNINNPDDPTLIGEFQNIGRKDVGKNSFLISQNLDTVAKFTQISLENYEIINEIEFEWEQIDKFQYIEDKNFVVFTSQLFTTQDGFFVPTSGYQLYTLNLETGEKLKVNLDEQTEDITDLFIAEDGSTVIYRGFEGDYFILNLADTTNLTTLGKYLYVGGLNYANEKIIFLTFDPVERYSSYPFVAIYNEGGEVTTLTTKDTSEIDPIFFNNSDKVAYSQLYAEIENTTGLHSIYIDDIMNGDSKEIFKEGVSLELPTVSPGDRYLVMEEYNSQDLGDFNFTRNFGYQTKPSKAKLNVYDLESNKFILEGINGIDAKWVE